MIVLDTDALVTAVWHERYLGRRRPGARCASPQATAPDHYLIVRADFVWVQDGTRESREHRTSMQRRSLDRV